MMSKPISGKEALIALSNGKVVQQWNGSIWWDVEPNYQIEVFTCGKYKFRIKPKNTNLNGVDVEEICSSEWHASKPKVVIIEFKTKNGARGFQRNAMKIFNNI